MGGSRAPWTVRQGPFIVHASDPKRQRSTWEDLASQESEHDRASHGLVEDIIETAAGLRSLTEGKIGKKCANMHVVLLWCLFRVAETDPQAVGSASDILRYWSTSTVGALVDQLTSALQGSTLHAPQNSEVASNCVDLLEG